MPAEPSCALSLTVAVLTFRRPGELAGLLPLLRAEVDGLLASRSRVGSAHVLVVDNDPAGSAGPAADASGVPGLRYVVESRPGIAAARNRALGESGSSDLLVFIDDDEVPVEGWLRHLVGAFETTPCVAVAGTVTSRFEGELDPWIRAGEFFHRRRLPTGTRIDVAATNNLLVDLRFVRRVGLHFDERYALTGGEDTLFTRALVAHGGSMVWSHEATVVDRVPRDRMTREWVLRRALSSGNTFSRTSAELAGSRRAALVVRGRCLGAAAARVGSGLVRYVVGVLSLSARHRAKGLRTLLRGTGMATGAVGLVYREYQRSGSRWTVGNRG